MARRAGATAWLRPAVLSLVLAVAAGAACRGDVTGPAGERPPGTNLLGRPFHDWVWLPSGREILYSRVYDDGVVQLEAVAVAGGAKRTVVGAPTNGEAVVRAWFTVVGSSVYFLMYRSAAGLFMLYRAPLAGPTAPQRVLDDAVDFLTFAVSPDERTLAWMEPSAPGEPRRLVTVDLATRARRSYALERDADRVLFSPNGRSVVLDQEHPWSPFGTPFQWVDLATGAVRLLVVPAADASYESAHDYRWEGDAPVLYVTGRRKIARYSFATGAREPLAALPSDGRSAGWSPDLESVAVVDIQCTDVRSGPFGSFCHRSASSVDRFAWRSGTSARVLRFEGPEPIVGRLSPTGDWFAYRYDRCGSGCVLGGNDGLYVVPVP